MKSINFIAALICLFIFQWNNLNAQNVNIPNTNFKNALLAHNPVINTNGDAEIQVSEAQAFTGALDYCKCFYIESNWRF